MSLPRAIGRQLLPYIVQQGMSATKGLAYVKSQIGVGIRKTDFLADYREFSGMKLFEKPLRALKVHTKIPKNYMVETELRRAARYMVVGDAAIVNIETGETEVRKVSMYTKSAESQAALTEEYKEKMQEKEYKTDEMIVEVQWYVVKHFKGLAY